MRNPITAALHAVAGILDPRAEAPEQLTANQIVQHWLSAGGSWGAQDVARTVAWMASQPLVYAAIAQRADSIASVEVEAAGSAMARRMAAEPEPGVEYAGWWARALTWHALTGRVHAMRLRNGSGAVVGYEMLRADWVARPRRLTVDGDDRPAPGSGWVYGPRAASAGVGAAIPDDDMLAFRTPDPRSAWKGLGPVGVATDFLDLDARATTFSAEWVANKGKTPGGFLISDEPPPATRDEQEAAVVRFQESLVGAGDLVALWDGLKYEPGSPIESPEIIELRQLTESRIISAFRTDGRSIGANYAVQASSGTADFDTAQRTWAETVLQPLYAALARWFEAALRADFGPGVTFTFDMSRVPALRVVQAELHKRYRDDFAAGLIPRNRALERQGEELLPGEEGAAFADAPAITMQQPS